MRITGRGWYSASAQFVGLLLTPGIGTWRESNDWCSYVFHKLLGSAGASEFPLHRGAVYWANRLPLALTLASCTSALAPTSQQVNKCFSAMQTRGFWSAQRCYFMRGNTKVLSWNLQPFTYIFVKKPLVSVFPGSCLCAAFLNSLSKSHRLFSTQNQFVLLLFSIRWLFQ